MNYMPTKSRKWLASGIATAVIASALSLFTVAPASAAATTATFSLSKPLRASAPGAAAEAVNVGSQGGVGADDTTALLIQLDDTIGDAFSGANSVFIKMTSSPADSGGTANSGAFTVFTRQVLKNKSAAVALNTWYALSDETLFHGYQAGDDTLADDDTIMALNFSVDLAGTYSFEYLIDLDSSASAVPSAGDISGTFSVTAYGAPTASLSSGVTRTKGGGDDTITITLTGGALGTAENFFLTDDSSFNGTLRLKSAATYPAAFDGTDVSADDTIVLEDTMDWRYTSANTMTLTVVLVAADGDDLAGAVKVWRKSGFVLPSSKAAAASLTVTATTLVSAIQDMELTSPATDIIEDDTPAGGVYEATTAIKLTGGSTVVAGTFQLTNASDYAKSVTVSYYDDSAANLTKNSTAVGTSTVVTDNLGVGKFSFTVSNAYLNAGGDRITITVGTIGALAASGSNSKMYTVTAVTPVPTPVWTVNGLTSTSAMGTIVSPIGGTISASVKAVDQFGKVMSGYSLALTTSSTSRNANKNVKSGLVSSTGVASVTLTDAGTTASETATAATRDSVTLHLIEGLEDDTVSGKTNTATIFYSSTSTLTAPKLNGYTQAAYEALEINPVVPFDGIADAYTTTENDDSDALMSMSVTSSILGTYNVVWTGSAGVRFAPTSATTLANGSTTGGTNVATQHDEGITKVTTEANSTTGIAEVYFFCLTAGPCTVTATQGSATSAATVTYESPARAAFNVIDVKVNDVAATTGTSSVANKVKVSFKVTDVFGNAVKTFGSTPAVDVLVSGVGSIDGLGSQGSLKSAANGTAQFYASSSAAGLMQIELDGSGGDFGDAASTALAKPASADKKTVTITWTAAPVIVPEVVYAAPTLTVTKSGNKIILDGTAVEGEGDIIVYIKRVGTTKWVEQAATIEVAAPGDYNGMRIAPKSNVLIRVKQEGTGKFSNQVVVLK